MKLFQGYGIELEYIITDAKGNIVPLAHKILLKNGKVDDRLFKHTGWSNELVTHLVELKTNGPKKDLDKSANHFQNDIRRINKKLSPNRLVPTGMHPWMNPQKETVIWELEGAEIYETYHKIFDCHRHGWANVQSMHLNLPFEGDEEFSRLHSAIRVVLPMIPAIAASSPYQEGIITGYHCTRLVHYATNSSKIPAISGEIIPEIVHSKKEYENVILNPMYKAIASFDVDSIMQEEWLNARGAIARFDRNAIEIRLCDIQECPKADIAICKAIIHVLRTIIGQNLNINGKILQSILNKTIRHGEFAMITNLKYLALFGLHTPITGKEFWNTLCKDINDGALKYILSNGTLSTRILDQKTNLRETYSKLAACLQNGNQL